MPHPLLALTIFALWTLALVLAVAGWRTALVLMGKKKANGFTSGEEHGSPLYWRLNRAHVNAVETLAPFAALLLIAQAVNATAGLVTTCAWIVTSARFGQTLAHVSSGQSRAVHVRFTFFGVQLACLVVIGVHLVLKLAADGT
jgi:uncharacterized MAPEG superfamily protein